MNGGKTNNKKILIGILFLLIFISFIIYSNFKSKAVLVKKEEIKKDTQLINLLIVGDMMLDRNVRKIISENGFDYFFAGVKDVIKDADIAIVNLEGPFTSHESITADFKSKSLQFTFDPSLAVALLDFGFDVVGLANNHTLNFGQQGLEMTRRYVGSSGVAYYGDPNNKDEISTVIVKNGIRVGLIGFHEFSYKNYEKVFAEIERLRPDVDILIVTPHWGVEYQVEPTEKQRKWAMEFIDSGADAVIGSHPHVIQTVEEYGGKKIYYSLGNFAFDQYFSKETMTGMGLQVEVKKSDKGIGLEYKEITFEVDRNGVRTYPQVLKK